MIRFLTTDIDMIKMGTQSFRRHRETRPSYFVRVFCSYLIPGHSLSFASISTRTQGERRKVVTTVLVRPTEKRVGLSDVSHWTRGVNFIHFRTESSATTWQEIQSQKGRTLKDNDAFYEDCDSHNKKSVIFPFVLKIQIAKQSEKIVFVLLKKIYNFYFAILR